MQAMRKESKQEQMWQLVNKKFHIPPILKNPIVEIHASTISLHHHNKVNPTPMKTMGVRQVHRGEQSISSIQAQLMCSAMLTNQICGPCWILGVLSTMSAKRFLAENCKTPNYGCSLLSLEDVLENAYVLPLKAKQEGVVFLSPPGGGPACKVKENFTLDLLQPKDDHSLFQAARAITPNIIM